MGTSNLAVWESFMDSESLVNTFRFRVKVDTTGLSCSLSPLLHSASDKVTQLPLSLMLVWHHHIVNVLTHTLASSKLNLELWCGCHWQSH